jgi:hypothetical protein
MTSAGRGGPAAKGPHPEAMPPPPSLLWWAGWLANRLPPRLALLLPARIPPGIPVELLVFL